MNGSMLRLTSSMRGPVGPFAYAQSRVPEPSGLYDFTSHTMPLDSSVAKSDSTSSDQYPMWCTPESAGVHTVPSTVCKSSNRGSAPEYTIFIGMVTSPFGVTACWSTVTMSVHVYPATLVSH